MRNSAPRSVGKSTVTTRQNMDRRRAGGLLLGLILLVLLAICSIFIGTRPITLQTTWQAITAFDPGNSDHLLVRHLRIPRTLVAIVVGCALGAAGAIMQALTRNPLAEPGILGVNAGAAAAIVTAIAAFGITDPAGYVWFGLAGAALAGTGVYLLGGVRHGVNPVRLVLVGAALTVVLLALTQIITVNSDEAIFDQFRHWATGSLQGRGYAVLLPVALLVGVGLVATFGLARHLDTVSLGQDLGAALGARPALIWTIAALVVITLAGAATAAAGPISFIGLAAPHVARLLAGVDHRWVLPYAMLLSALLLLAADVLGRILGHPGEVGAGIMAALIGGPFFVALVRRRRLAQL